MAATETRYAAAVLIETTGQFKEIKLKIAKNEDDDDCLLDALEKKLGGAVDGIDMPSSPGDTPPFVAFQPEGADDKGVHRSGDDTAALSLLRQLGFDPRVGIIAWSKNFKAMGVLENLGFDTWGARQPMRGNVIITGCNSTSGTRSLTPKELDEVLEECRKTKIEKRYDVADSSDDDL